MSRAPCLICRSRSNGSRPPDEPSTTAEPALYSPADPKGSGSDVPILARRSAALPRSPRLGADCLYAPGLHTRADIRAVVAAVAPTPVNVLVGSDFTTVDELAQAGVRRISVGGGLARAAWAGFLEAATEIAQQGTFIGLSRAVPSAEINRSFESASVEEDQGGSR